VHSLTSIAGAAGSLLNPQGRINEAGRRDLLETIHEEAFRLDRLVASLLDMTRLESGALRVTKEWLPIEEVIGGSAEHTHYLRVFTATSVTSWKTSLRDRGTS